VPPCSILGAAKAMAASIDPNRNPSSATRLVKSTPRLLKAVRLLKSPVREAENISPPRSRAIDRHVGRVHVVEDQRLGRQDNVCTKHRRQNHQLKQSLHRSSLLVRSRTNGLGHSA
jgi:hypothetical protein